MSLEARPLSPFHFANALDGICIYAPKYNIPSSITQQKCAKIQRSNNKNCHKKDGHRDGSRQKQREMRNGSDIAAHLGAGKPG